MARSEERSDRTRHARGWLINDVYALQNLMESFLQFEPLTPRLSSIKVPTMIMTGEYDFLTPRPLQDSLRTHIPDSALVIIPRAYHAFTLERAELAAYVMARFAEDVIAGRWHGKKTIWVAPEEVAANSRRFRGLRSFARDPGASRDAGACGAV